MYVSLLSRLNAWNHAAANVHMIHWRCPKTELKTVASHAGVDVQSCLSFTDHHTIELYGARSLALIEESVVALMFRPCFLPVPVRAVSRTKKKRQSQIGNMSSTATHLSNCPTWPIFSSVRPSLRCIDGSRFKNTHGYTGLLANFKSSKKKL